MATIAILSFVGHWQNFLWQLVLVRDKFKKTLIVGIAEFVWAESRQAAIDGERGAIINYGTTSAGAVLVFIPMLIIFLIFNR